MKSARPPFALVIALLLGGVAALAWLGLERPITTTVVPAKEAATQPIPVEVAAIERGPIERRRTFTGTLVAHAQVVVAPKVGGRIERLYVDLADTVTRGQPVAELDNDEFVQAVAQARANLVVAEAGNAEAQSLLRIAERELERIDRLRARGVSSESQLDLAKADQLAKQAQVEVTRAQVTRARAELEAARIRLGYTQVTAGWRGAGERRVVAERFVDEGETISANTPLLRIVELDPITAVFSVTERDYARLQPGQGVELATDAYPGDRFAGEIERVAPVFRESTRQARIEARVANPELRLKPGMFVRTTVILERVADATLVPEQALTTRDGRDGLFLVDDAGTRARWREVGTGIRQDGRVAVDGEALSGRVVVLGQHLLDDGSPVVIANPD